MKCQILSKKNKNITNLSSAELAQGVIKVKDTVPVAMLQINIICLIGL